MNQPFFNLKTCAFHIILVLFLLSLSPAMNAEAKWWIFGKSDVGVSTRYIYINNLSYDELGEKVTIYQESLLEGKVFIRGKGSAGKNQIGAVQISLDGKQSWQKAKVTSNGSFNFSFTPEVDHTYELYVKILDTTGKSSDVEASRKELMISTDDIQNQVYKTLDQLIKAYQDEDSFAFMRQVSDDFVSGAAILDSAIRQDFTAFDNIRLHYTLNNVTRASGGNLFVAISFSRMVTSSRSGETFSDQATTEFIFKLENGVPKIYSMKNPLIFGLSDASEVATGTINSGDNSEVLVADSTGTVELRPISEIDDDSGSGSTPSAAIPTATITFNTFYGFFLSTGAIVASPDGDIFLETYSIWSDTGAYQQSLGTTAIESITAVPNTGYGGWPISVTVGETYALQLGNGNYAIIQFTNITDDGSGNTTVTLKYRYQADGSRNF